jgi:hypothetical protein
MPGAVGLDTKELDIVEPDALVLDSMESAAGLEVLCHNLLV